MTGQGLPPPFLDAPRTDAPDHLLRTLKEAGYGKCRVEGMPHADWVLIDAGDVIVHLFRPEVRSFYNIEKIWSVDTGGHRAVV